MGVFHFNDGVMFGCMAIDANDPLTDLKLKHRENLLYQPETLGKWQPILKMLGRVGHEPGTSQSGDKNMHLL